MSKLGGFKLIRRNVLEKEKLSENLISECFSLRADVRGGFGLFMEPLRPSVLLHACCGPCASSCIERLSSDYNVTVFFYNPNIMDNEEYLMRREALLKFINEFNEENIGNTYVGYIEGEYEPLNFIKRADRLKDEPEGGKRCDVCFEMRLSETAIKAGELGMDYFTTSMSVSPHKNYEKIRTLGIQLESRVKSKFLDIDFKKKNGFGRSIELSRKHGLYRQSFCGCEYARYTDKKKDK